VVFPRSIFPLGLLRAQTPAAAGAARVFKLVDFLGSAERLAWAKANGCPWVARTCYYAAQGGHLEVLQWARQHGCPSGSTTCSDAARGGHLAVLRWAREHDCPWNEYVLLRSYGRALGGAAVGAGARLPVEQVDVCSRFPAPPRDSGMGVAAASVGQLPPSRLIL